MDDPVSDYFHQFSSGEQKGNFHHLLSLQGEKRASFEEAQAVVPDLPKGWYELCALSKELRVEFVRDHWLSKLPFAPHALEKMVTFFDRIETVEVYITQKTFEEPHEARMVYRIKNGEGFYQGFLPLSEEEFLGVQPSFEGVIFPEDYLAFLKIHNGFCKSSDTGLLALRNLKKNYDTFQEFLEAQEPLFDEKRVPINPKSLIPFYESFGLHCYHCFFADWYPENEMGNLYYSGIEKTLSRPTQKSRPENLSFVTFLDWLLFYLEGID